MFKLEKKNYPSAYQLYRNNTAFFPLIAAVLLDDQNGVVYADDPVCPKKVYVEHDFGFSQLFGDVASFTTFIGELEEYLLVGKKFHSEKVRLYSPCIPDFLLTSRKDVLLSERQRFHLDRQLFFKRKKNIDLTEVQDISLLDVGLEDVALVEKEFGVVNRCWRDVSDFIRKAKPSMVSYNNKPATICYSAATAAGCAEIDVLSLSQYREIGLAGYAVTGFIEKCLDLNIKPMWDCYTNNDASVALASSLGFVPFSSPYKFFTINR